MSGFAGWRIHRNPRPAHDVSKGLAKSSNKACAGRAAGRGVGIGKYELSHSLILTENIGSSAYFIVLSFI